MATGQESHEFALYTVLLLESLRLNTSFVITDPDLVRRITRVLRLNVGDSLVLFNTALKISVLVQEVKRDSITLLVTDSELISFIKPSITWLVPVLEREAFEQAVSFLTVLGVTTIIPVLTQKAPHAVWLTDKEQVRLRRIMIAAAEQAKQFYLPTITSSISLSDLEASIPLGKFAHKFFFDPQGKSGAYLSNQVQNLSSDSELLCFVGPAGDLTSREKEYIRDLGFIFYQLTPTILRAEQALFLATGLIRTLT